MTSKEIKYYKKFRRKVTRAKYCPFCGKKPFFKWKIYDKSSTGGVWHHAKMGCNKCKISPTVSVGFSDNEGKQNPKLLWSSMSWEINEWNKRAHWEAKR
ncbi:hypothetical protein [Hydrogenimonas thermophila]|uniref:Restriction alleviation protein, Lar family n=1 Tax=Hydrogenimonas thermophila TaxID=223786 RepID=A0A1I5NRE3_9BACT|nr:hypothetical protein [Hydrogenimonas thermophila]SFP23876.1 hypothetical protein SAMN05216234_11166 [Hydrogenimonas thermophila]